MSARRGTHVVHPGDLQLRDVGRRDLLERRKALPARIVTASGEVPALTETFASGDLSAYEVLSGANSGFTVITEDGSLAAHFEFTVAVTSDGSRILTPWHLD